MTDKEKLQALFEAAMRSPVEPTAKLKRAVPGTPPVSRPVKMEPAEPVAVEAAKVEVAELVIQSPAMELDKEAVEELGNFLDERIRRNKRRHRTQAMVSALVILGSAAGGIFWFVQDKQRVIALQDAAVEIRSAGDVNALVDSYQGALDGVAARGTQLDETSTAMGIDPAKDHGGDIHMEVEMQQMMGADGGRTVGQRNKLLVQNIGNMIE